MDTEGLHIRVFTQRRTYKRMKPIHIFSLILIIILLTASATLFVSYTQSFNQKAVVYVGVAFCGNSTDQAKLLIDRTKSYTNLFVLDSGINPISTNQSAVEEICDYAVNSGLNIIVNLGTWTQENWPWQLQFYNTSREKYGDKFLGAYYDDEVGGIPLDWDWPTFFSQNSTVFDRLSLSDIYYKLQMSNKTGIKPESYSEEAKWFNQLLESNRGSKDLVRYNITTFTSDYALYWFDYLGGYDNIFAQLGWNESVNQQISFVRGAATMQNKDWGAIITWKYKQSPYLDTGENIYNQMVTAYNAGAKYITIFDYPYNSTDNPYGIMTDEHFQSLEKFWNQVLIKSTPNSASAEAALVLPKDYGWGMRSLHDKIWGFWGPDDKSPIIWNNTQTLLNKYGLRLDIIYDDPAFPIQRNYSKVYFWNQTI
jgi:hypothetical protein